VLPHLNLTTLGIPLGGQSVKHRQLARQVGERIEDPSENSMAVFKFACAVHPEGTTFIFGSWSCVADGAGGFRRFSTNIATVAESVVTTHQGDLMAGIHEQSIRDSSRDTEETDFATTSDRFIITDPDLSSVTSNCSIPLSQRALPGTTVSREVSGLFDGANPVITSIPEKRLAQWEGFDLSELLDYEDRLVAHLGALPYQEGKPLATIEEEPTEVVDASSDELMAR
jgi:hypothetical protein